MHTLANLIIERLGVNALYVFLGVIALSVTSSIIGCFAFLRKQALMGDALSHAVLPGICIAFLLSHQKNPWILFAGAGATAALGAWTVYAITTYTRCKPDSALAITLSVYFGLGIVLLTYIQQTGNAAQSGLDRVLFGQAASLLKEDVITIVIVSLVILVGVALVYKPLKILCFDPLFAHSIGINVQKYDMLLYVGLVLAVAVGLQTVGVVLMAALLVTPAAAARYWTNHLVTMLLVAAFFGAVSGAMGTYISASFSRMPTGPWIVLCAAGCFALSFLFAPERGWLGRLIRARNMERRSAEENVLKTLYQAGEERHAWDTAQSLSELQRLRPMALHRLQRTLRRLLRHGWITEPSQEAYTLTESGFLRAAAITRRHRLWETYLAQKMNIPADHVHRDAEEMEHLLAPEMEHLLADALGHPTHDPHGKPIPPISETQPPRQKEHLSRNPGGH
jgi:manganese/zinc/iron transport system permease protein